MALLIAVSVEVLAPADASEPWGAPPPPVPVPGDVCQTHADCMAGEFCSPTGYCEDSGFCQADRECPVGFVCDERSTCVPAGREAGSPA